ncbi:MAG: carboxylesterase family protein [Planctomycetota bacterium]|nr:carboxylesterase family protein [Planctomycetota bacterium]
MENLTVDGHVLRGQLSELFAYGHQRPLPFITGTTRDEGASFVKPMGIRTAGDLRKLMQDNSIAQQAMRLVGDVEITDDNATEMASELITRCFELSADFLARSMTLSAPTRMYRFDRHSGSARRKELGVHHGCELRYVFGNLPTSRGYSSVDREISNRLRATLLQFARGEQNLSVDAWTSATLQAR